MKSLFLPILMLHSAVIFVSLSSAEQQYTATVIRVIDGDTIKLDTGEKVRLIGIDTPEKYICKKLYKDAKKSKKDIETIKTMGEKASRFTKKLVEGKKVRLEYDVEGKDRYGRLLAYIYVPTSDLKDVEGYKNLTRLEVFLNAELVKQGYAQIYTFPPNVKYQELFLKLQKEARDNKRGLWNERQN